VGSALPVRLLHISDLHAGSAEETAVEQSLEPILERAQPELIVVTGDLTHRGRGVSTSARRPSSAVSGDRCW